MEPAVKRILRPSANSYPTYLAWPPYYLPQQQEVVFMCLRTDIQLRDAGLGLFESSWQFLTPK